MPDAPSFYHVSFVRRRIPDQRTVKLLTCLFYHNIVVKLLLAIRCRCSYGCLFVEWKRLQAVRPSVVQDLSCSSANVWLGFFRRNRNVHRTVEGGSPAGLRRNRNVVRRREGGRGGGGDLELVGEGSNLLFNKRSASLTPRVPVVPDSRRTK